MERSSIRNRSCNRKVLKTATDQQCRVRDRRSVQRAVLLLNLSKADGSERILRL